MNDRRIGRFTVADQLLRAAIDTGDGANLFDGVVPLDVRRDWFRSSTEYIAWHRDFRPIGEGECVPEYRAVFRDGQTTPTWELAE